MKATDMRVAFSVGEGEESRPGGVEAFEGVGGRGSEVDNTHGLLVSDFHRMKIRAGVEKKCVRRLG
jgi:hypothetical protein